MHLRDLLPLLLLPTAFTSNLKRRDYQNHDYYALHISSTTSPEDVASLLSLTYEEPMGELADHHIFSSPQTPHDLVAQRRQDHRTKLRRREPSDPLFSSILFHQKAPLKPRLHKRLPPPSLDELPSLDPTPTLYSRQTLDSAVVAQQSLAARLNITDPIFTAQWHLLNTAQPGNDINVTGVWLSGNFGQGATVAIVDDGIDMHSDDIAGNYFAEGSWDYNDPGPEPHPRLSDDHHGTRCAGEIAAVRNDVCGVGVAYQGKVSGIRILSAQISDIDEAKALNYGFQKNHIYSCSWGPPDDGMSMDAPSNLIKRAMLNGIQNGRDKKGSLFVFASGNGARAGDNCNFDGYTNSIYSITVGAIDRKGLHPYYSELCSAQLVVTYSSGSGDAIHTTDVGKNKCNKSHGGTSAAAPLAAGVFALVVSARPDLTWRDLQWLVVDTAVPVNEADGSWQPTPYGKKFSHKYGYGKLDSWAIVEAAKSKQLVKPQAWFSTPWMHVRQGIPEGEVGLSSHFSITGEMLKDANFERVEQVTVTMNINHSRRGDIAVELVSPGGVVSHLSVARPYDAVAEGYIDWTFMTVAHFGEAGVGDWKLVVKDVVKNGILGNLTDWKMTLWGECIDAARSKLLPMPTDHDDDDHDKEMNDHATTTVSASTVTDINHLPSKPTGEHPPDHVDRPVNEKPAEGQPPTTTSPPTSTATTPPNQAPNTSNLLPSFFPTFGASAHTQVWIYAFFVLVILFISGLGTYLYRAKRKRDAMQDDGREGYEFDIIGDSEDEGEYSDDEDDGAAGKSHANGRANGDKGKGKAANGHAKSKGKGKAPRQTKGGEMYDAFAEGESGGEEDIAVADEADGYRDEPQNQAPNGGVHRAETGGNSVGDGRRLTDRERLLGRGR